MKDNDFSMKMINYMYLGISRIMNQVPFSGRHWMEQYVIGIAQYFIDEYWNNPKLESQKPIEICRVFHKILERNGYIQTSDYRLGESGDNLLVSIKRKNCNYQDFSLRAKEEGLTYNYCIHLVAMQAILHHVLGENYSTSIKMADDGFCYGKIFPTTKPREEIVTREKHVLKIADRRAILLPQETYASLLASVKEHAPHVLKHVLYDAGYQSGLSLARKTIALYPDPHECLQVLLDEIQNQGLGNVELVSVSPSRTRAIIRCYDSFQVAITNEYGHLYRTPQVICDLLRGFFAAYLSVLFEKEIICEEMACQSMGAKYCEFLALPLPKQLPGGEEALWSPK
ncbi:V4R domain-containing protein [Desulfoscipio gibsoniae]|uniref:Putative hydrocarbon binding protein (Contains V4R domain) n=1 Tax=Desulfoscipio gibsoniae DSM 7213 TaxID=767817 RepID=R4KAQ7_9FIRM|nr:4-vinyl reductase [Desulfoscipio gibsoniae]AGL00273.1 putative hydrocarbon binding protein (contains V4R domain) [Desulfoscipio gibsoniae DSM 7213]